MPSGNSTKNTEFSRRVRVVEGNMPEVDTKQLGHEAEAEGETTKSRCVRIAENTRSADDAAGDLRRGARGNPGTASRRGDNDAKRSALGRQLDHRTRAGRGRRLQQPH